MTAGTGEPALEESAPVGYNRWDALCLALVGAALVLPLAGLLAAPGPPMEEGFMLAFPEQILAGRVPHRDFLHLYGPGSIYVLSGVYELLGTHLGIERLFGWLQHCAVGFGLWFLIRPFGRRMATASALTAVVVLLAPSGATAMAWNGALALATLGFVSVAAAARRKGSARTNLLALAGALWAGAILYRPDVALAVGAGGLAWMLSFRRGDRAPAVWGFALTSVLWIPHLVRSGFGDSFHGMFIEPVFELRAGRTLPSPPSWGAIDGFLDRVVLLDPPDWLLPMLEPSNQIFIWFWLMLLCAPVSIAAGVLLRRQSPASERARILWPLALFTTLLLPQALQRPDPTHLAWVSGMGFAVALPSLAVLYAGAGRALGRFRNASAAPTDAAPTDVAPTGVATRVPAATTNRSEFAAIATVVGVLVLLIPFNTVRVYTELLTSPLDGESSSYSVQRDGREFKVGNAEQAKAAQEVVDALDGRSQPGDSLVVAPEDLSRTVYIEAWFYHLFGDLVPGTRYMEMDPGLANSEDSVLGDELQDTDWLILSRTFNDWSEPNDSVESGSPNANAVVDDQFCTVMENDHYELLGRC